mgnify:CR=1 FL=1
MTLAFFDIKPKLINVNSLELIFNSNIKIKYYELEVSHD